VTYLALPVRHVLAGTELYHGLLEEGQTPVDKLLLRKRLSIGFGFFQPLGALQVLKVDLGVAHLLRTLDFGP